MYDLLVYLQRIIIYWRGEKKNIEVREITVRGFRAFSFFFKPRLQSCDFRIVNLADFVRVGRDPPVYGYNRGFAQSRQTNNDKIAIKRDG